MQEYPIADLTLARRLERAEGMADAAFVDARRELQPHVGASWTEIAGVYAMFDGVSSPITQTFGLGIFELFRNAEFEEIEAFFDSRGAATAHEVCSFAAPETLSLLSSHPCSHISLAMATSVKDRILETLSQLAPTATVEDAMERLYCLAKVERGVADLDAGRVVSHEDIRAKYAR